MPELTQTLQLEAARAVKTLYQIDIDPASLAVQDTNREFEGDFTIVIFPLSRYKLGNPQQVGDAIGAEMMASQPGLIAAFNTIKGFLNLSLTATWWQQFLQDMHQNADYHRRTDGEGTSIMVEYCSPNTNKPLHLGHLRNLVLGSSLVSVLAANGYAVQPVCLYNDRGTAICKSMYAWALEGKQPLPPGKKGDAYVGDYYVMFSRIQEEEVKALIESGQAADKDAAVPFTASQQAINEMLLRWEANDPATRADWAQMNGWVYQAHEETYNLLGIRFNQYYYESDLYESGRAQVEEGIERGIFFRKEDGSAWVDLTAEGLDQKLLLRSNGTTVYMTQDIGTADAKYADFPMQKSIYVVGNEQDYHFKVLFHILRKLGRPYSDGLYHLSYGMVDLPTGKMKSREGTTVEIDDLVSEVKDSVRAMTEELGKTEGLSTDDLDRLHHQLALGAIKFFLAKVEPQKRMVFNPAESVDLRGHTGPFIQYSHARISSILRKAAQQGLAADGTLAPLPALHETEKVLLRSLLRYRDVLRDAGNTYNPALIANYVFDLAKDFNRFYDVCKVIDPAASETTAFRLRLAAGVRNTLKASLALLGIEAPERM